MIYVSDPELYDDLVNFKKTKLYQYILEQRRQLRGGQMNALIEMGAQSSDPDVRRVASAMIMDGHIWSEMDAIDQAHLGVPERKPTPAQILEFGEYDQPA